MRISGKIKLFKRVALEDFQDPDGVHDLSRGDLRRGIQKIKGAFRALLNGHHIFYGVNGFYYPMPDSLGVKVFYSLVKDRSTRGGARREWGRVKVYHRNGLGIRPVQIEDVDLDLEVSGKRIQTTTLGIVTERVQLPEAMWDFSIGLYYDFRCLDYSKHPQHTPDGYKSFRERVRLAWGKGLPKTGTKLGDIVYCMRNKRWFVVDCGGV